MIHKGINFTLREDGTLISFVDFMILGTTKKTKWMKNVQIMFACLYRRQSTQGSHYSGLHMCLDLVVDLDLLRGLHPHRQLPIENNNKKAQSPKFAVYKVS